ncbi:MAG: hypothetical protein LC772_10505 [Chloroflexi bacterium]|nr:hypothetical protein [Chloroflexota bacterium]
MINRPATLSFLGTDSAEWGARVCLQMLVSGGFRASISARDTDSIVPCTDERTPAVPELGIKLTWANEVSTATAAASPGRYVACILGCGKEGPPENGAAALAAEAAWARVVGSENPQSTAIYSEAMMEQFPEVTSGVGRQYTVSARHPVEAGAYLAGGRIRIVGRVDSVEASLPDASIPFKPSGAAGSGDIEALLCAALAALEMGVAAESIDRAVRALR